MNYSIGTDWHYHVVDGGKHAEKMQPLSILVSINSRPNSKICFKYQQSLTELHSKGTGYSDHGCLSIKSWNWAIQWKEREGIKKKILLDSYWSLFSLENEKIQQEKRDTVYYSKESCIKYKFNRGRCMYLTGIAAYIFCRSACAVRREL